MRALLLRHAEATGHAPEADLTPKGKAQARALALRLRQLTATPLYASPYRRAQQTLAPYAAQIAQQISVLEDLREQDLAAPEGSWLDHQRRAFDDDRYACPGGESLALCRARAAAALLLIQQQGGHMPVIATHGTLLASLLRQADPGFGFDDWRRLRNPDLFKVTLQRGRVLTFDRIPLTETP